MEKAPFKLLKNDVVFISYRTSKADTYGNRYQDFGKCFIVRKGQRIHFEPVCSGLATSHEQETKKVMKDWFNIDIRYLSDYPNIIVKTWEIGYRRLKK